MEAVNNPYAGETTTQVTEKDMQDWWRRFNYAVEKIEDRQLLLK